ncbi:uncharacterized protein LOC120331010 [Styela clava]|uniref:cilia- and flagella-associated protein 45-like n=1 Tax=Styela clava TaxID=7725 RepID=UPI00193AA8CE|nr:cilia- and flagella-associated protein 45-like [Styela clava]
MDGFGSQNSARSRTGRGAPEGTPARRSRGETPVNGLSAQLSGDLIEESKSPNRFSTMKKAAEEQRRKVRETRVKQHEEERALIAQRRQEELKLQIRAVLDNILVDTRKDILLVLQDRINQERHSIKGELKVDLEKTEDNLTRELEKRLTNGEPFENRVAKVQKEFEDSFNKILKSELGRVQREILQDVDQRIDKEKHRWEENFRREADTRVRTAEENIRQDFRHGLEDSQQQCDDIVRTTQERTNSLENRLMDKIDTLDHSNMKKIQECEETLKKTIDDTMTDRDANLTQTFKSESDRMRQDITDIRGQVTQLQSKCCTIL